MSVFLLGQADGGAPFDRRFFRVTLGDILKATKRPDSQILTLHLTDGQALDICEITALEDPYMIVRGYRSDDQTCELTLQVIPYGLIYRLSIAPHGAEDQRMGFHLTPANPA